MNGKQHFRLIQMAVLGISRHDIPLALICDNAGTRVSLRHNKSQVPIRLEIVGYAGLWWNA